MLMMPGTATPGEMEQIREKMRQMGTANMSAYLRKMALDGLVVRLNLPELRELVSLMRRVSNNLNQIAKRANESGHVYESDILAIKAGQEKLWNGLHGLIDQLNRMKW